MRTESQNPREKEIEKQRDGAAPEGQLATAPLLPQQRVREFWRACAVAATLLSCVQVALPPTGTCTLFSVQQLHAMSEAICSIESFLRARI